MKTEKLYFGAAYYSEYLPYDRVEKDMEMMEKAGMNVIRIAESTWSTLEPQEGVYDFTHIDRMLNAAACHHISVIVGTPTYAGFSAHRRRWSGSSPEVRRARRGSYRVT